MAKIQDYGPKMHPRYWVGKTGYSTLEEAEKAAGPQPKVGFKTRKAVDPQDIWDIVEEFRGSTNPRDILVGDEVKDALECYPSPHKAAGDAADRMDELIRAARLARTKLRRLL